MELAVISLNLLNSLTESYGIRKISRIRRTRSSERMKMIRWKASMRLSAITRTKPSVQGLEMTEFMLLTEMTSSTAKKEKILFMERAEMIL